MLRLPFLLPMRLGEILRRLSSVCRHRHPGYRGLKLVYVCGSAYPIGLFYIFVRYGEHRVKDQDALLHSCQCVVRRMWFQRIFEIVHFGSHPAYLCGAECKAVVEEVLDDSSGVGSVSDVMVDKFGYVVCASFRSPLKPGSWKSW